MASEICSGEDEKTRGALIEKFVEIAKVCDVCVCVCVWCVRCGCALCEPIELNPQLQCMSINVPLFPWLQQCHEHKNFNTTTSIVSGLSLAAVRRLKRSWEVCGIMYILLPLVENILSRLEKVSP